MSSASEDGRNYRPKHAELVGIIIKPLLLHLVGCLYYCNNYKSCTKRAQTPNNSRGRNRRPQPIR